MFTTLQISALLEQSSLNFGVKNLLWALPEILLFVGIIIVLCFLSFSTGTTSTHHLFSTLVGIIRFIFVIVCFCLFSQL